MGGPFFDWIKKFPWFKVPEKEIEDNEPITTAPMEYYDKLTLERIEKFHPLLRDKLKEDYIDCNNQVLGKWARLRFAQVFRTIKEQNDLYAQGRTKPGNIVTNAKGGRSMHNYGLAFDIVILYDKDQNGTFETASWELNKDWMNVVKFFKARGYEWGGDWHSFKDYPHFQQTLGYTLNNLQGRSKDINGYPIL